MEKRIGIACDHAGFEYKEKLVKLELQILKLRIKL